MNQWLVDLICGSISGILGTFVGHPLDTVKCRLQVKSKEYSNTFISITKIIKEEKFIGLFKGVIPPTLNQIPVNAMYDNFLSFYQNLEYSLNTTECTESLIKKQN